MKKVFDLLKGDNVLRLNICVAGFLALVFGNIILFDKGIRYLYHGGKIEDLVNWALPFIGMDLFFVILLLFMYVISDKLFKVRNAVIFSLIVNILLLIDVWLDGNEIVLNIIISNIITNTIMFTYILIPFGIIIRGIWESMQDRVGGEYKKMDLNYKEILSNKNTFLFSLSMVLYSISLSNFDGLNIRYFFVSISIGLLTFISGIVIRYLIYWLTPLVNRFFNVY